MAQELSDAKLYDKWTADIRATDEISFKLIGIVPLVSGTGLITILFADDAPPPRILITLSLFAAAITLVHCQGSYLINAPSCRSLSTWHEQPIS